MQPDHESRTDSSGPQPRGILRRRSACALAMVACIIGTTTIATRGSSRPIIANQSLASGAGLLTSAALALAFLAGALAPRRTWRAALDGFDRWRAAPTRIGSPRTFYLMLALALLCQGLIAHRRVGANRTPVDDQADYLRVAREVVDLGGPLKLNEALRSGRFTEANRHPLYVVMLATRPTFAFGILLSQLFGFAITLTAACYGYRAFGPLAGGIAALLLALNAALHDSASLVACETLLTLLLLLCWILLRAGRAAMAPGAIVIGGLFGLAYLTKASAFFPFVVTLGWVLLDRATPIARRAMLALALLCGFGALSLSLLTRNVRVYGTPLHSFNTRLLFEDTFEAHRDRVDLGLVRNARRFLREHTWREMLGTRLAGGLAVEAFVLLRSLGPVPFDSARAVFGVPLLLFALAPGAVGDRRSIHGLTLCWLLVFWIFFAWYLPIAASDRFIFPLVPPLLILASGGMARTVSWWFGAESGQKPRGNN